MSVRTVYYKMALREGLGSRSTSSSLRQEDGSAGRRTNFSSFSSSFDEFGPPYADLPMEVRREEREGWLSVRFVLV